MYVRTKWLNSLLWEGVFPVASCFHVQFEVTGELGMLENVAFCVRSCHFALLNFKNQIIMGDYAHNFKPANFTLFINGRIKIRIPNRSWQIYWPLQVNQLHLAYLWHPNSLSLRWQHYQNLGHPHEQRSDAAEIKVIVRGSGRQSTKQCYSSCLGEQAVFFRHPESVFSGGWDANCCGSCRWWNQWY